MKVSMQQCVVRTCNAGETEQLGEQIGARLRGGEVIELCSDLGGGKTTFVRGLARGFGSSDRVSSPTFTISQIYHAGERSLHHFDFYRLNEPGIMADELAEIMSDPQATAVIEWGDIVQNVLPAERLSLTITAVDESTRQIVVACPDTLAYLLPTEVQA